MNESDRKDAGAGESDGTQDAPPAGSESGASRAGSPVLVDFSNPDEFLAELRDRGPNVDGVLRLAYRWHADTSGAPITDLWVVANYLRRIDPHTLAVVRLEHHAGSVWWPGSGDATSEESRRRAEGVREHIAEAARVLGIKLRAGAHRAAPPLEEPR